MCTHVHTCTVLAHTGAAWKLRAAIKIERRLAHTGGSFLSANQSRSRFVIVNSKQGGCRLGQRVPGYCSTVVVIFNYFVHHQMPVELFQEIGGVYQVYQPKTMMLFFW